MDDLMSDLVERTDAEQWPPLATDGAQIRRRGRRRRLQQRAVYVGGTGLVATGIIVGPLAVSSWRGDAGPESSSSSIVMSQTTDEITTIFDVSVVLPLGWDAQSFDAPDGQRHACLGPSPLDPSDCAVVFVVAADPYDAYQSGIDDSVVVGTACAPTDMSVMTVTEFSVDSRQAHAVRAQCSSGRPAQVAWALDNRTFAVVSGNEHWDADAQQVFEQARTPDDWPHRGVVFPASTATASPR